LRRAVNLARRLVSWQLGKQAAEARFRFPHLETPVNLPSLANRGVHYWNPKILLQHIHDAYRLPAAALDVDAVGVGMSAVELVDVRLQSLD